jgi:hypothetical protein
MINGKISLVLMTLQIQKETLRTIINLLLRVGQNKQVS